jgi:lipopolysaccharide/colanic/teichoic acid biosynthesis glycosyltransferase
MTHAPHTAVILAGGSSSFNGFAIATCPKALLPIANVPSYRYLANVLGAVGVKRLIFCVRPGGTAVATEHLALWPTPLESLVIETSLGTGGSVKGAEAWLEGAPFWVVSGDLFLGMGLDRMLEAHRSREAIATVGSLPVLEAAWDKERVELDADNEVKAIHRIHHLQERRSMHRPAGLYLFEPAILQLLPVDSYFDLKEQLFPILYERGLPASLWEIQQYCRTISSLDDYFWANLDVLAQRVIFPGINDAVAQPQAAPAGNAAWRLLGPVALGPDCRLADEVLILGPTAMGPRCEVGKGAIINECVILGDTLIGRGSYLSRCVVGEGTTVRNGTILHESAIIKSQSGERDVDVLALRESTYRDPQSVVKHLHWQTPAGPFYLKLKRIVDVMAAALGLIITAPLLLIIAVAIKLDSPGKVFFRQSRCGLMGRNFIMYKFRSMVSNSEELKREIQAMNEVDGPMFKISGDPRITRVGKFLRDTNLDELPQLWNVLKGDMSLVGTRPLTLEEMRYNPRWRDARLSVRPGMTGLWQVEAHSKLQFNYWILHDLDYAQNISPSLDLKIMGKTMCIVVRDFIKVVKGKAASR